MMQADCKEFKEKFAKLSYIEEVIRRMLEFLYCGNYDKTLNNTTIALLLLKIDHQYDIYELEKTLKGFCPYCQTRGLIWMLLFSFFFQFSNQGI